MWSCYWPDNIFKTGTFRKGGIFSQSALEFNYTMVAWFRLLELLVFYWFFHFQEHFIRRMSEETCQFCGDIFSNKYNCRCHVISAHPSATPKAQTSGSQVLGVGKLMSSFLGSVLLEPTIILTSYGKTIWCQQFLMGLLMQKINYSSDVWILCKTVKSWNGIFETKLMEMLYNGCVISLAKVLCCRRPHCVLCLW